MGCGLDRAALACIIICIQAASFFACVDERRLLVKIDSADEPEPIFSVIIPLEYHRGQWEQCWVAWQDQNCPATEFEIILVVPRDFSALDEMLALTGSRHRIVYSDHVHDIGLCAEGALAARGKYLFFTEAHCWPESDVLSLCKQAFAEFPEWAALSCQSVPIVHNRLSRAEADMYQEDIEYGLKEHSWRKILDQCFVTKRDAYFACGGFKSDLGHFSEWVLAADYFDRGYKIGYLPEAKFHHYYVGSLPDLQIFTQDFVDGEIKFFGRLNGVSGHHLLEAPAEWTSRSNYDRRLAGRIVSLVVRQSLINPRHWPNQFGSLMDWVGRAATGNGLALALSALQVAVGEMDLRMAVLFGSQQRLSGKFKDYIGALIRYQRLKSIRDVTHNFTSIKPDSSDVTCKSSVLPSGTGFHGLETFDGQVFRWSEMAAMTEFNLPAGRYTLRLECLPTRNLTRARLKFYLDEHRIPDSDVTIEPCGVSIRINQAESGTTRLGWTCTGLAAKKDRRRLGIPIHTLRLDSPGPMNA